MASAKGLGIETARGIVHTWECDAVEHFTTAAYFRHLSAATMRMLKRLGFELGDPSLPWTESCVARFMMELRVGDVYDIASGVVESGGGTIVLGHTLRNSPTGEVCTTFLQELKGSAKADASPFLIDWEDRESSRRPDASRASVWLPSSATIVRAQEVDWAGRLDLGTLIDQLSAANVQCLAGVGMSPSYMRENRTGYSTAEYQLRLFGPLPGSGAELESESAVVHVGRSSVWAVHRLYDRRDNELVASLGQLGVHLDLDRRKASTLPDEIRQRALRGLKP